MCRGMATAPSVPKSRITAVPAQASKLRNADCHDSPGAMAPTMKNAPAAHSARMENTMITMFVHVCRSSTRPVVRSCR